MHNCDIHTHNNPRPGVPSVVDVSGRGDFVFGQEVMFSVGIHPKYITDDWEGALIEVAKAAAHSNCVAIGECGLDKFADAPLSLQEKVLESQIVLARDFAKPLIIHCVRLYSYVIHLLRKRSFQNPVVFHGYNGNPDITAQLLKMPNAYFSFSESTFATPETSGSKSLPLIPVSRILTETDCNAAADINVTIKKIADKKQMDASSLQQSIYENFMRIVGGTQAH
ncbi:MAG: TatD family hydrolase [Bacteroidales bacterium]|nr:TatD family hydrolase [Bacteroidales bacterium]